MSFRHAVAAFAVATLLTNAALADEPDPKSSKAVAEALFQKGQALVLQKNFAEACPKLAESVRLDPALGGMLWLADCYENNGQTASAWAEFREAAGVAAERKDSREAVAKRRAAALEPKLSTVTIVTPRGAAISGLEIRRDGVVVSAVELGVAVPADPGIHAISASAPGHKTWSGTVNVPADRREPLVVNIPLLEEEATPAPVTPAPEPQPVERTPLPVQPPPPPPEKGWSTMKIVGAGTAGAGVVGVVIGTVLGLSAKSALDASKANGHCLADNECDATGTDKRHSAQHLATGSTVAFILGGVFVAGGATLFLLAPSVSAHEAGFTLQRRF